MNGAPGRVLYVADPMCSWCWGFAPAIDLAERALAPGVELAYVMGGLAPDSDEPMPAATRRYVQDAWRAVAERTGASFDHAFWVRCEPRRSTYPACRAVLAAGERGREMFRAIQRAYYTEARNPSERATLVELAGELGLDMCRFESDLDSAEIRSRLAGDLARCRELGISGFPSVAFESSGQVQVLTSGWVDSTTLLTALRGVHAIQSP